MHLVQLQLLHRLQHIIRRPELPGVGAQHNPVAPGQPVQPFEMPGRLRQLIPANIH
ncbi:hypothetical protein D3C80_2217800 [compost metagenome]